MNFYTNKDEFYITVFSSTSSGIFNNTLSKFQVQLPIPIVLDPLEKYVVAMTDICHAPILGLGEAVDSVTFKKGEYYDNHIYLNTRYISSLTATVQTILNHRKITATDELKHITPEVAKLIDDGDIVRDLDRAIFIPETYFEEVGTTLWSSAKQPFIYTREYFHEFLSPNNLENLETGVLSKYKTTIPWKDVKNKTATIFLVPPLEIAEKFKSGDTRKNPYDILLDTEGKTLKEKVNNTDYIVFLYDFEYTCHQIFYRILTKLRDIFNKYKNDPEQLKRFKLPFKPAVDTTVTDVLLFAASYLVHVYQQHYEMYKAQSKKVDSYYVMIYSDFVEPHVVGDQISNILYLTSTPNNDKTESIEVKNLQYIPVNKFYIDSMAFKLCNEYGEQLFLAPGYLPTSISLHFKKVK